MEPGDIKTVLMGEFSAMRAEITTFISLEVQFLTASVALAGVLVGFAFHDWSTFQNSLDVCPIPFLVLALLYADTKARVLRAASYIQDKLQPELRKAGLSTPLQWEDYIRKEYHQRGYLEFFERMRWLVFLGPAIISMLLAIHFEPTGVMSRSFFGVLIFVDVVMAVFVIWIAVVLSKPDRSLRHDA
jgi:hypothetical protein